MFEIEDRKLKLRAGHWQKLCYDIADVVKTLDASSAGSFADSEDKLCFERAGAYLQMAFFVVSERNKFVQEEYIKAQKLRVNEVISGLTGKEIEIF